MHSGVLRYRPLSHTSTLLNSQRKVMSGAEWSNLVTRLNESSKQRKVFLLRAQHQQIADELAGFSFAPAINERSRELAAQAHYKSLPERASALMRKKKAKLDRIRHEKAQLELAEATFKPKTNVATRPPTAAHSGLDESGSRGVGQLLQFVRRAVGTDASSPACPLSACPPPCPSRSGTGTCERRSEGSCSKRSRTAT